MSLRSELKKIGEPNRGSAIPDIPGGFRGARPEPEGCHAGDESASDSGLG